jgi:hypothetical protein
MDSTLQRLWRDLLSKGDSEAYWAAIARANLFYSYDLPLGPLSILEVACANCGQIGIVYSDCPWCLDCRRSVSHSAIVNSLSFKDTARDGCGSYRQMLGYNSGDGKIHEEDFFFSCRLGHKHDTSDTNPVIQIPRNYHNG